MKAKGFLAYSGANGAPCAKTDPMNLSSRLLYCLLLAAAVFAVYANTLGNGFVYDDNIQLVANPWITDFKYLPAVWSTHSFGFMEGKELGTTYRPLAFVVYMAEHSLFGFKPWAWHLVNIILHLANTVLVFFTASLLLKVFSPAEGRPAHLAPFAAALIFALHPVNSETVAWVACVPELVYTFLCVAALNLYVRSRTGASYALNIASAALFFIALFAKETAIALPLLVFIFDLIYPDGKRILSLSTIKRYLPYAALFALYFIIRLSALEGLAPRENMYPFLGAFQYVLNGITLFAKYLRVIVFPVMDYPFQVLDPVYSLTEPRAIYAMAVAFSFFALLLFARKRVNGLCLLSAAIIVLPILPALYIPGISRAAFADRYLYLPTLGFGMLLSMLIINIMSRKRADRYALAAVVLVCAAYAAMTAFNNTRWKDEITLWRASLKGSEKNYFAMYQLGAAYMKAGQLDEGIEMSSRAIEVTGKSRHPDPAVTGDSRLNLAYAFQKKGLLAESAAQYEKLLESAPADPVINYNIASVYLQDGMPEKAIAHFSRALDGFASSPDRRDALLNLGNSYMKKGDLTMARQSYEEALRISPGDPLIAGNLRVLERMSGR